MMRIGFVELVVLLGVGVVVAIFASRGLSSFVSLFKSVRAGHATLNCPHCGRETTASDGRCQQCGRDL